MNRDVNALFQMPPEIETRWATAENPRGERGGACRENDGRKRVPYAAIKSGQSHTMAEVSVGSGTVRRIWITVPEMTAKWLRGVRLDLYWDAAEAPAVSVPLGDFFCQNLGRMAPFQNALFSSPEGRSFTCVVPMPFQRGMKIVATNETEEGIEKFFYEVDYTIGDKHPPETLYFHAHWRRENPTVLRQDFEILPHVQGRGRYLGASFAVLANTGVYFKSWWGEGEVKIFLDGDTTHPTLCGTGTEDYIGTGWGQGQSAHLYQGCPVADAERSQYAFYRLHLPDPVFFRREVRVTIQQIGCWSRETLLQIHGSGLQLYWGEDPENMSAAAKDGIFGIFERMDDWSSCAYFYLDRPENKLPALPGYAERVKGLV